VNGENRPDSLVKNLKDSRCMQYIERKVSLLTKEDSLEHLYTFEKFPVFMGCVDGSPKNDLAEDEIWDICSKTGLIQLRRLLPQDVVYLNQHNDGIGKTWQDHYVAFAQFLLRFSPKSVLEIGGAHDHIACNVWKSKLDISWTTIEPNPEYIHNEKIKIIKDFF